MNVILKSMLMVDLDLPRFFTLIIIIVNIFFIASYNLIQKLLLFVTRK